MTTLIIIRLNTIFEFITQPCFLSHWLHSSELRPSHAFSKVKGSHTHLECLMMNIYQLCL